MEKVVPTVCPLDCPDRCALDVSVEDGRLVKIDGSRRYGYTDGYICAKVRRFGRRVASPERVLHPMRRRGPKGSGAFERISWDSAIAEIAERFAALARDPGPESILPFHYDGSNGLISSGGMDMRLWHRLGASRLARTFCAANTGAGWTSVFGDLPSADQAEAEHADAIVIWGMNPSASGIHLVPLVRKARAAGAFLAVVDPRRTPLAKEADLHLPVRPGTDVLLALAMIRAAQEEALVDRLFIEQRTRGYDALLAACPAPEAVAAQVGIPADAIRGLPRALARSRRPFFRVGWGLERNRNGTDAVRAVLSLRAVMGRFGTPGAGVALGTSPGYRMSRAAAQGTSLLKGNPRTINMSELGRMLEEASGPPIRALYVYNSNPVATAPDQGRVVRGLAREDLFTVVHEQVRTDTCEWADLVLPATTFLEHTDLSRSYGGYVLQWGPPALEPAGESRPNHRVFAELAAAMGFAEPEFQASEEDVARAVTEIDPLRKEGIRELPRPRQFVDAFPAGGRAELSGPPGPPAYLPPPSDAALPLVLISPSNDKAISSQLYESSPAGSAVVSISPVEAAARGLNDGDRVRLRNSLGEVQALLQVSEEIAPGVASLPKGLWRRHTLNGWTSNALVPGHVDRLGGGACYNDARIEIDRA